MAIQVAQITGDTVELVFNPAEDHLHVGQNLSVVDRHENRGLIVQIVELKTIFSVPRRSNRKQPLPVGPQSVSSGMTNPPPQSSRRRKPPLPTPQIGGLQVAIAQIRKMTGPTWHAWDGWIPMHDVIVTRTADHEMLRQCLPESKNPLRLGRTLAGEPLHIEGAGLGGVNLIVGAKGSGAAHLTKVIIGELIDHGIACVVFDTTGTYSQLSPDGESSSVGRDGRLGIVHLAVGESLRLGIPHFGLNALLMMLTQFGLPKAVAMYFESHVARRLALSKRQDDAEEDHPFLGIDDLIRLAQDLEADGQAVVGGAILSCLEAIRRTQVLASHPDEATAFWKGYAQIRHGGALVIDLSRLPRRAQPGAVSLLVGILKDLGESEPVAESSHSLCMFFDDAQPLSTRHFGADVVIPARQLGLTSYFVTTMVNGLDASLLHEADNLFLSHTTSDADIRHLAKSGVGGAETLRAIVQGLRQQHSLLLGKATGGYPIIFTADPLGDVEVIGEEPPLARTPDAVRMNPAARAMPHVSTRVPASAGVDPSLPLFPDEPHELAVAPEPPDERMATTSEPPMPTAAQVAGMWDHVVKRVARRRRILATILSAARPLRINGRRLVLSFPPQHRFQQELVESEEYRSLLEEELKRACGVSLEVTTEVYPA
jgi:hypothetical protein